METEQNAGLTSHCLAIILRDTALSIIARKCHTLGKKGKFYIGGYVLRKFIKRQTNQFHECQQYKTAYLELTFACRNAVAFYSLQYFLICPLTLD